MHQTGQGGRKSVSRPLTIGVSTCHTTRMNADRQSDERLEGRTSILAALEAGCRAFRELLVGPGADPERISDVLDSARRRGVPVREVDAEELGAQAKSHGGLVAVASPKPLTTLAELYALVERAKPAFLLLIEGADDPRNLGYVLRTAEAFGAHAVLVRRRAWDLDSTTVSRSSSGAFERIPLVLATRELDEIDELKKRGLKLVGCIPRARDPIYKTNLAVPVLLAVGGEKRGLSGALRSRCDRLACIPTVGGPTSLSMTQAAAVILAEAARQRGLDGSGFTSHT